MGVFYRDAFTQLSCFNRDNCFFIIIPLFRLCLFFISLLRDDIHRIDPQHAVMQRSPFRYNHGS
jgi:hypothetical protein